MNKNKLLADFGLRIKKIRNLQNISQEQLAEKAHMHRTYIGMLERGEKNATLTTLFKLSEALNISICEIFKFELGDYNE